MPEGPGGPPPVILASGSPRRRELLRGLGVTFEVVVSGEDEDRHPETDPARLAADLARLKGRAVAAAHPGALVLAADTVVAVNGVMLAKPADATENVAFLRQLAGRTHDVFTGVAALHGASETVEVAHTSVTFRALSEAEMAYYAASGEGLDKAGGYGVQGLGMSLVSRLEGEYSNVVGFPLSVVIGLLRRAGVPVWGTLEGAAPERREAAGA